MRPLTFFALNENNHVYLLSAQPLQLGFDLKNALIENSYFIIFPVNFFIDPLQNGKNVLWSTSRFPCRTSKRL
ncbi:UNVERIFIED_CONTAM: hypothetical protein ABID98_005494 [Brevibacillus sp. OAP136]